MHWNCTTTASAPAHLAAVADILKINNGLVLMSGDVAAVDSWTWDQQDVGSILTGFKAATLGK